MTTLNHTDFVPFTDPILVLETAKQASDIEWLVKNSLLPESNLTPNKQLLEAIWEKIKLFKETTTNANDLYNRVVGEVLPRYVTHPQVEAWLTCKLLENIPYEDFTKEVTIDDIIRVFESEDYVIDGPMYVKDLYAYYQGKTMPLREFATAFHRDTFKAVTGNLDMTEVTKETQALLMKKFQV